MDEGQRRVQQPLRQRLAAARGLLGARALLCQVHPGLPARRSSGRGGEGVVTISEQVHRAYLGANYYQLGQLSKFVQPGAVRIASDRFASDFRTPSGGYGVTPGLDDVAFLNPDSSKVLVANNTSPVRIRFAVAWHGLAIRYALAPGATATFIWR